MTTKLSEIGWRERVGFPDLGIPTLRAKIDTGARTSALHAVNIEEFFSDGEPWVRFHTHLFDHGTDIPCQAKLIDLRAIKNTSGRPQNRFVISTSVKMANRQWMIDVSLADRDNMGFPLILGRTAIRKQRLLVNSGRSYLAGNPVI